MITYNVETIRKHGYLITIVVLFLLGIYSFIASPYFTKVSVYNRDIDPLSSKPVKLFRYEGISFYYTSEDLVFPDKFGDKGKYIQSFLFDIYAKNEGHEKTNSSLTWILQIKKALSKYDVNQDSILLKSFIENFSGLPKLERGDIHSFPISEATSYFQETGVQKIIALAIKDPGQLDTIGTSQGNNFLYKEALTKAFNELSQSKINSVGVPLIMVRDYVGDNTSRSKSWFKLLLYLTDNPKKTNIDKIVFGGFGISSRSRQKTDSDFRQTWESFQNNLTKHENTLVHEILRLAIIVLVIALIGSILKKKKFGLKRMFALLVVGIPIAVAIAELTPKLRHYMSLELLIFVKIFLAISIGSTIEFLVKFEPQEHLK